MTATNIFCQPKFNSLHFLSDGANYLEDGTITGIGPKVRTVPHWPGLISGRGSVSTLNVVSARLAVQFGSFDEAIAGVEDVLPFIVEHLKLADAEIILAGLSKDRGPESYVINTSAELPMCTTPEQAAASEFLPPPFKLQRLPPACIGPVPTTDVLLKSGYHGVDLDAEPEKMISLLLHLIEAQRYSDYGDGICWVGGFAELTTINDAGIFQRVLHRWPDDEIGYKLDPGPVDWAAFNRPSAA